MLEDPRLDLVVAPETWSEVAHELPRRISAIAQHCGMSAATANELHAKTLALLVANTTLLAIETYVDQFTAARRRVPRDPNDAPTVAAALALDCGIWTADHDFFGCGVPVWTTETLLLHVEWLART